MMSSLMYRELQNALKEQKNSAVVTIVNFPQETMVGKKFLVIEDGSWFHDQSETEMFSSYLKGVCQSLIRDRKTKCVNFLFNHKEVECFIEVFQPPPHLIIAGAGHVCVPVVQMASFLGYYITVIDDRSEFATVERFPLANEVICKPYLDYFRRCKISENTWILLLTRGHQFDVISLQELLMRQESPAYIGMIGSRRRITGVFSQLKDDFKEKSFEHIYAPVGLDIGAETPSEIAVSIVAEMLKVKNHKAGHSLSKKLCFLANHQFRGVKDDQ